MKLEACLTLRKGTVKLGLGANHLGLNPPGHIGDIVQAFDLVGMKPNPSHGDVALIPPALGILTLGLLGKRLLLSRSVPTLCNPEDCSTPGFPVLHCLPEFAQTHVHRVDDYIQPSHPLLPLLLLPWIFPSIKVFSNRSALHIRWPKFWSCSFKISPSNEYSGLPSSRID